MIESNRTGALLAIPGAILVVAFFMPWIDILGASVSGYDMATADALSSKRFLLWLAPLAGAALAMVSLSGSKSARDVGLAAGAIVLLPSLYYLGKGMMFGTSWGLWMVLIGATGLVALAIANKPQQMALPALFVIGGFLLPWTTNVTNDFASWGASGWAIATGDDLFHRLLGLPSPKLAWLVPLAGAAALAFSLSKGKAARVVGGAAGLLVIGWLSYVILFSVTGWGFWLTIAAGCAALLLSVRKA